MEIYRDLYKNNKNYSIQGLDIGNAVLKSHTGIKAEAKITTSEPIKQADKLTIDDKTYYLGVGNYDTTFRKIKKEHYLDMMYGLLALSTKEIHNKIALGLPLSQYKADKKDLINMIMSNSKKIIEINDIKKTLIIEDCEVFPEGVSTLKDDEECIIIDVGGGTTDAGLVINEHGSRKVIEPISIPKGTIKLYQNFADKLNFKYGLDLELEDAERILNKGQFLLDGQIENIDFALEEYKEYTEQLISRLQLKYSLRTNYISVTGGGAEIAYNPLKNRFGNQVRIQTEPLFANARNFYELGCSIFE